MKFSTSYFSNVLIHLLLLLELTTASTSTTNDTVEEACSKLSNHDHLIPYNFCLSSLKSVPESHNADLYKLGLIAINLMNKNVTLVSSQVKTLLNNTELSATKRHVLNQCSEVYSKAHDNLSVASTDYKNKDFKAVIDVLADATDSEDTCEEGYNHLNLISPFTKINTYVFRLAVIVYNIMDILSED